MLKYINGIKVPSQLEHLCMCSVNERKTGGEDPLYENMITIKSVIPRSHCIRYKMGKTTRKKQVCFTLIEGFMQWT